MIMTVRKNRWLAFTVIALMAIAVSACTSGANGSKTVELPTATPGTIAISVDRPTYSHSQPIGATVTNISSKQDYYATSGRSDCSYLQLQQYNTNNNSWVSVSGCVGSAPQTLRITHNTSIPITLAPGDSSSNTNQWTGGLYRIALQYTAQSTGDGPFQVAYSAGFQIQS